MFYKTHLTMLPETLEGGDGEEDREGQNRGNEAECAYFTYVFLEGFRTQRKLKAASQIIRQWGKFVRKRRLRIVLNFK